jgi:hypothetical protein
MKKNNRIGQNYAIHWNTVTKKLLGVKRKDMLLKVDFIMEDDFDAFTRGK